MKHLFSVLLFICSTWNICAATNAVRFNLADFTTAPVSFKQIRITPLPSSFPRAEGTQVVGVDPVFKTTDANGLATNLMVEGDYSISFTGRFVATTFRITTPSTNCSCLLNASALTSSGTNLPGNLSAYSQASSDARFVLRASGSATNVQLVGTNSHTNGVGMVWTAITTNGHGKWATNSGGGSADLSVTNALITIINAQSNVQWSADNHFTNWTAAVSNYAAALVIATNTALNNFYGTTFTGTGANVRSNAPTLYAPKVTNAALSHVQGITGQYPGVGTIAGFLNNHHLTFSQPQNFTIGTEIGMTGSPFSQWTISKSNSTTEYLVHEIFGSTFSGEAFEFYPNFLYQTEIQGQSAFHIGADGSPGVTGGDGFNSGKSLWHHANGSNNWSGGIVTINTGVYGAGAGDGWALINRSGSGKYGNAFIVASDADEYSLFVRQNWTANRYNFSNTLDFVNLGNIYNRGAFTNGSWAQFVGPVTNLAPTWLRTNAYFLGSNIFPRLTPSKLVRLDANTNLVSSDYDDSDILTLENADDAIVSAYIAADALKVSITSGGSVNQGLTNAVVSTNLLLGTRSVLTNNDATTNVFIGPVTRAGGVTIGPGGNVGVGTNNPAQSFTAVGSAVLLDAATTIDDTLTVNGAGGRGVIASTYEVGAGQFTIVSAGAAAANMTGYGAFGKVGINNASPAGILDIGGTFNNYALRVMTNILVVTNGNVGIGTTTPRQKLEVAGGVLITNTGEGLRIGAGNATLTNTLYASATLDFPSTVAGTVSDLPITVAGAADGDIVALGEPSASIGPLTGVYNAWASNGVVYVRFANNNLSTAQDPASGVFRVRVDKFQ